MGSRGPAVDARHRILRQYWLGVVEFQSRPQPERPSEAVRRNVLGFDHLALRLQLVVDAVERVPNEDRRVAGDIGRAPDRIEIREINLRHEAQCPGRRVAKSRELRARRLRGSLRRPLISGMPCDP
jgi:hypothetical protein